MPDECSGLYPFTDVAVLENGNIFVLSRLNIGSKDHRCFLYEKDKNRWKICPDKNTRYQLASCGAIKRSDGREEVVVVGGLQREVHIFSTDKFTWRQGMTKD
jgi:hypothetical protein